MSKTIAEGLFKNKIKNCNNTSTIYDLDDYVKLKDVVNIVECLIALLETSGYEVCKNLKKEDI